MGLGRRLSGVAVAAVLGSAGARAALADAYSVTFIGPDEAFVIDDTSVAPAASGLKRASMMIVAAPGSSRHAFIYTRVTVEFDCAANKVRYASPLTSKLDATHTTHDEMPGQWSEVPLESKIGATLAHVCSKSTHVVVPFGDHASPDAAADFLIAAYGKLKLN